MEKKEIEEIIDSYKEEMIDRLSDFMMKKVSIKTIRLVGEYLELCHILNILQKGMVFLLLIMITIA